MHTKTMLATIALILAPALAIAHDVAKGPNGGQVVDDNGHHIEFTTKDNQIMLFLADNGDKPITTKGATGRVIVQDGAKQSTADLVATEPNLMTAKMATPIKVGAKLVVSVKLGDGHDVKARFVAKWRGDL